MTIEDNYTAINNKLKELRSLLLTQLFAKLKECGIIYSDTLTDEELYEIFEEEHAQSTFEELIDIIDDIKAPEIITDEPKPTLVQTQISQENISTFNLDLYKRILYYADLLKYYLILKSVPKSYIKATTDLKGLINLISKIEIIKISIFTITEYPNPVQYYGDNIVVPYTLKDVQGNDITEGDITIVDSNNIIYDSFTAGEPISFAPLEITQEETYYIKYNGSDKYYESEPSPNSFTVTINPSKIRLKLTTRNKNTNSKYYNSNDTGAERDTWGFTIKTLNYYDEPLPNIPFTLQISEDIIITDTTNNNGTYTINQAIREVGTYVITCETNYENSGTLQLTNSSIEHTINIKYNTLQHNAPSADYAGKDHIYTITTIDEDNNTILTHDYDNQNVKIYVNDVLIKTAKIQNSTLSYNFNNLPIGKSKIKWVVETPDYNISTFATITLKSNFSISGNKELYYLTLNSTPIIYYKPNGVANIDNVVIATLKHNNNIIANNVEFTTQSNGKIKQLANYTDIGLYELQLTSTNNLNETIIFNYEIKQPFDIELSSYKKNEYATYIIHRYYESDDENYGYNISITNNNQLIEYTTTDTVSAYILHIDKNDNTIGENVLSVTANGYSVSTSFKLLEHIFSIPSSIEYGSRFLEITCYDDNVESINVSYQGQSNDTSIVRDGSVFQFYELFTTIGTLSIDITDIDAEITETFTLRVVKASLNYKFYFVADIINNLATKIKYEEDDDITIPLNIAYIDKDNIKILYRISNDNILENQQLNINCIFKSIDNNNIYTQSFNYQLGDGNVISLPSEITTGLYDVYFSSNGNEYCASFNGINKAQRFTVSDDMKINNIIIYNIELNNDNLIGTTKNAYQAFYENNKNAYYVINGYYNDEDDEIVFEQETINEENKNDFIINILLDENENIVLVKKE